MGQHGLNHGQKTLFNMLASSCSLSGTRSMQTLTSTPTATTYRTGQTLEMGATKDLNLEALHQIEAQLPGQFDPSISHWRVALGTGVLGVTL